jgi:hypothetical protein
LTLAASVLYSQRSIRIQKLAIYGGLLVWNGAMSLVKASKETKEKLQTLIESMSYDYDTGQLYWKVRPVDHFTATKVRTAKVNCSSWNKNLE